MGQRIKVMGRRSNTETVTAIMLAFLEQRTWRQKALADHCGVSVKTLRRHLTSLSEAGYPLVHDTDPPHVYWSVPKGWFPGAVAFNDERLIALVRALRHTPSSPARAGLLAHIARCATGLGDSVAARDIVTPQLPADQEEHLSTLEDSSGSRVAARLRYFSASRGDEGARHLSVHRVVVTSPVRFVATCHRDRALKWFRLDGVLSAALDTQEPYQPCDDTILARFLEESVDGFHSGEAPTPCRFRVRLPEARWLQRRLPLPVKVTPGPDGYLFEAHTSGLVPLARILVGLGAAVRCETLALAELVARLAEGALSVSDRDPLNERLAPVSGRRDREGTGDKVGS